MRQGILWVLFLYLVVVTCASALATSKTPPIETIIACIAQARAENQTRFRSYIVTRDYKLFGKNRAKTESQVIADITFVPPATKQYAIQKTDGTGFGETIVRRMLTSEVEIAKDYASTDFSSDNYDFRFILAENVGGRRCYLLELLPKRKDKNLLRGNIWVDAETYLPRRIEGEPVKTPSWWLRNLHIELSYGEVGGMWLQTALEATAAVRILGPHTVVARDVKYQLSDLIVAARPEQVIGQGPDTTGFARTAKGPQRVSPHSDVFGEGMQDSDRGNNVTEHTAARPILTLHNSRIISCSIRFHFAVSRGSPFHSSDSWRLSGAAGAVSYPIGQSPVTSSNEQF